jgi:D-alanine-D-alanine ligase and related ATP-grasp enzymes
MKDSLKKLRIGVLMGGRSAEREISLKTGNAVLNAFIGRGIMLLVLIRMRTLPKI